MQNFLFRSTVAIDGVLIFERADLPIFYSISSHHFRRTLTKSLFKLEDLSILDFLNNRAFHVVCF